MGIVRYCYHHLRNSVRVLSTELRERGAMTAEYVGILLVVGVLVAALLGANIGGSITTGINNALRQMGLTTQQAAPAPGANQPAPAPAPGPGTGGGRARAE
jgi:hypothetical protein